MSVDGLTTGYLKAGRGEPVVLLHGGEFGGSAELGWERNIPGLAERYRVLAPDQLGLEERGEGHRLRRRPGDADQACGTGTVRRWASTGAHFVGNSMGAIDLLTDATSDTPLLSVRTLAAICGGGEIQQNRHFDALQQYDATLPAMQHIVEALFYDPGYPADEDYVRRRYESSIAPGAWEAVAAARFRRPDASPSSAPSSTRPYERIAVRRLSIKVSGGLEHAIRLGRSDREADRGWPIRWWLTRPVTVRRSSSPLRSTTCCSTSSQQPDVRKRSPARSSSRRLDGRCCGGASPTYRGCRRPVRRAASALGSTDTRCPCGRQGCRRP